MIRHISCTIDHLLSKTDDELAYFFDGDGKEIRKELQERKDAGERLIPSEGCNGFDPVKGCPGHHKVEKAITIKQPWAQLIAEGIKDIENRTWKTNFRGRVYIHSSAKDTGEIYKYLSQKRKDVVLSKWDILPKMHRSAIIGEVDIVDCVQNHTSIWADRTCTDVPNQWNWVLANAIIYPKPILYVKGRLSFWIPDPSIFL